MRNHYRAESRLGGNPIGTNIFMNNKVISTFKEFSLFTGITNMHGQIFNGSTIKEIDFPTSLRSITGSYTFLNCSRLKKLEIPEGVTQIASQQWIWSSGLTTLILPSTLTASATPYLLATYGAKSSLTVICKAVNPTPLPSISYPNCIKVVYVPDDSVNQYKTATGWSSISGKIKPISEYAG